MSRAGSARLGATHDLVLDALYDRKRDNKSVRVLTVIIYVFCVSLAAIMLSLYYVFFWEPKDTQRKVAHSVDRQTTTTTPMPTCLLPHTGRGNSTVNDTLQQLATSIGDSLTNASARLLSASTLPPSTAATLTNDILGDTDAYNTTSDVISPLNDTNVT